MDEKNPNLENANKANSLNDSNNSKNKPKKKGKGLKIAVGILIIVMAIMIGVLSWLLISGKDFSTMFNKNNEEQSDNKNVVESNNNDSNNNNNTDNNKDNNGDGMASGKGGDDENVSTNANLKDSFKVRYDTRGVRNITVDGASFVCNEDVPDISGISSTAKAKIEKEIADRYSKVWEDINKQTSDDYIKELLKHMNENSQNNGGYAPEDIGFHQTVKVIYLTNKIVTFQTILEGGLGGVGWGSTSGVSFDLQTGDVIEVKNLVTSKDKYIETCKNYAYAELKKDSRYPEVIEMHGDEYEGIINSAIDKLGGYFIEEGIVCAEIPKYSVASGASGEFKFTVPYSAVKDYINTKYLENISTSIDNSKQDKYTTEQLEKMALDYYEKQTGYRPSQVASQVNDDGTISIQLYDNMGDHNSTSAWYTVDAKTAVGTDLLENIIDLKE